MEGKVVPIFASTIYDAWERFSENPDIAIVAMDACVPGDEPNTFGLIHNIRKTFTGPMIAISSLSEYSKKLIEWGCSHESEKDDMPQKVLEILGL